MKLKELKPRYPTAIPYRQCSVPVPPPSHNPKWRQERYVKLYPNRDYDRCQRNSTVEIDGKPYCRLHGGSIALDYMLKGASR